MRLLRPAKDGMGFEPLTFEGDAEIALARKRGGERYLEISAKEAGVPGFWRMETTRDELVMILATIHQFEPELIREITRKTPRGAHDAS